MRTPEGPTMPRKRAELIPADRIEKSILTIRDMKVMLDSDLAKVYGVTTTRLNQQISRNVDRFPDDFSFVLTREEFAALKLQIATSNIGRGGRQKLPRVFTEHGAVMAATVLNSAHAVQMTIFVVRAFVKTRELLADHRELAGELDRIKQSITHLDLSTRRQFDQVYEAILGLMAPVPGKQ